MIVGNRVLLVLSQTQEVHEEIEETLEMLRKAGGLKTARQDVAGEDQMRRRTARLGPTRRLHIRRPEPHAGGGMGGMGGMGGGMGGMGGGMGGGMSQTPHVISVIPVIGGASPGGDADLLGGLKSSNAANQKAKVLHLKQRQDAGQGQGGTGGGMGGSF